MTNVLMLLIRGREYISDPSRWCQGSFKRGEAVCSLGAIYQCADIIGESKGSLIWDTAACCGANEALRARMGCIPEFNDTHSHAEVLAMWDAAIADVMRSLFQRCGLRPAVRSAVEVPVTTL